MGLFLARCRHRRLGNLPLLPLDVASQQAPVQWVTGEVRIVGNGVAIAPAHQEVLLNESTVVRTSLASGGAAPHESWRVEGDLSGPALPPPSTSR